LAHALYHHYSAPTGFDYDTLSNDEPFIDDEELTTYNAWDRTLDLYNWIEHQATHYDILITMGDDFHF
jgi:lysosomal alpha-mannosidase